MRARRLLPLLLAVVLPGCSAFSGAPSAGRRASADLFVVLTSPVQIPVMAARDAATSFENPWVSAGVFPASFVWHTLRHTGLLALYSLDLVATPLHLFNDLEAPRIYRHYEFPMSIPEDAPVAEEAADMALWGIGMVGGTAVSVWFFGYYVPGLFMLL